MEAMATPGPDLNIYNISIVPPPLGQHSNFNRTLSDTQIATIAVFAATYFLATVSLAIRYATSVLLAKKWELDVILITVAWGAALGYFVSVCFMMKYGWGSHAWDVSLADMIQYNKFLLPTTLTYTWSPTLTKLSILFVLYRINPAKRYRVAVYVIATVLLIYTIAFTVLLSVPCNPATAGTDVCFNNLSFAQVVLNITTNLSIIILPLPTLHRLQMRLRQKVVVGCILSIGSAVLVAPIVRAPYVYMMATDSDFTRKQAQAGIWSLVELNMGIVCNNSMRLKPFIDSCLPRVLSFLGVTSNKTKPEGETSAPSNGNWRGRPSNSYPLYSLKREDLSHTAHIKQPSAQENALRDSYEEPSRINGSMDSILRS